jgi:2-phosphoglycerate kinase
MAPPRGGPSAWSFEPSPRWPFRDEELSAGIRLEFMQPGDDREAGSILWLGGSPCAGKSTVAALLARRFGLDLYRVDEAFERHASRLDAARQPALVRWCAASADERWLQPIDALLSEAIACYREHWRMVLEDVVARQETRPLLVEGTALLPAEVARVVPHRGRALWLVADPDFQRRHYRERAWAWGVVASSDDPERAFENWMERDVRFASWVAAEADALGQRWLTVDGGRTVDEVAAAVAEAFGLGCAGAGR